MTEKPTIVIITAIIAIAIVEVYALSLGFNGTLQTLAVAAMAGLGGWAIKRPQDIIKK